MVRINVRPMMLNTMWVAIGATIVRYVKAADELVHLCSQVPTTFPDEG